jgi:hypothetical protein
LIDLQDKGDLRALGDIVRDLRDHSAGADFMLVGAAARDLWLQHHHGIEPRRKTTDVDFAFAVSDWPAYIALTKRLIDTGGFKPDDRTQHRLRNRIGTVVDHAFRVAGLERLQTSRRSYSIWITSIPSWRVPGRSDSRRVRSSIGTVNVLRRSSPGPA